MIPATRFNRTVAPILPAHDQWSVSPHREVGGGGIRSNVFPRLSVDNPLSNAERNLEMSMKPLVAPLLIAMQATHFYYLLVCQLVVRIVFASLEHAFTPKTTKGFRLLMKASLFQGVPNVVFLSSKKQVRGIGARAIVACVANIHSMRNWTMIQFPRYAVSVFHSFRRAYMAVTSRSSTALPNPTTIGLLNNGLLKTFFRNVHIPDCYKQSINTQPIYA
jgi:hypothetical protein